LDFPAAYALTVVSETAALFLLLRNRYGGRMIARDSLIANTLTHPAVWFLFPLLRLAWPLQTALAELFAFTAEAAAYRGLFPGLGWKGAAGCSLICNSLSFTAGLALEHVI
jgi:hypothetical protein